ncbi:unnamed protein product [Closterium sp. NIES-54]
MPPCPAAHASPCLAARASPCPAARASPCPTARALPCPTARVSPCHAARASPCRAARLREWVIRRGRSGPGASNFLRSRGTGQQWHQCQRRVSSSVGAAALGASKSAATLGASETAATGASESATSEFAASAEALHTFTPDSGASRCFFRDCTTVTPLTAPVPVSVADPSRGSVIARASIVLPCPAVPSGSLSGLHLPSFSTNLVRNEVLEDVWFDTFIPGGQRVAICTCSQTGRHLAMFTRQPGSSLYILTTASAQVAAPGQVVASMQVSASGQFAASCSWQRFREDLPVLCLHSDRGGEISSDLLRGLCPREGILQSFTLLASPQQNGVAELRIGFVMEVARTFMIHAAAPHFLWPFAVRYVAHQLNLWPRVSLPETLPTLRWTRKVGDASVFRVWGSRAFVRDTSVDKLSARAIPCVFLGFPPYVPGWQFYHPTLRRVLPSQDITFGESVPFYRLFPYRSAPLPPPPLFLASGSPPVDPLPPQGPAPSSVSQVDPLPLAEPVEVTVDSGVARGTASGGAASGGAEPASAEPEGVQPGGYESEGSESRSAEPRGTASAGGPAGASP